MEAIAAVAALPWSMHEPRRPDVVFGERVSAEAAPPEALPNARRVYIRPQDITDFGHTVGCPKCDYHLRHNVWNHNKPHSEACRSRIMEELQKTDVGKLRIARAVARSGALDEAVAREGEQYREDVA